MCMCGAPTINGHHGYSWNGEAKSVYPINPPDIQDGDTLLFDEPGRCGGTDSHSYHFRLVKSGGQCFLLVRHGGGDERISVGTWTDVDALASLDSNARYWLMCRMYHTQYYAARDAREKERRLWTQAAAEKRIKTRKQRGRGTVKVWIETKPVAPVVTEGK